MTGPVFVDTNVFVYLHDDSEPEKKQRADDWIEFLVRRRAGRLSFQVLQEFYAVLTRTVRETVPGATARAIVRDLMAWRPTPIDLSILERAWAIEQRYALSWWDSLIVAAAHSSQCKFVLTEDLQDGQVLGEVRVIDPFAAPQRQPAEVLADRVSDSSDG